MFCALPDVEEDLGRVLTPDPFDEDEEMAAARDIVTADLKCFQQQQQQEHIIRVSSSTPPPPLGQFHPAAGYLKQENNTSGAAGSTCGTSSPQASCDTAAANTARGPQFWTTSAQQYDAAYSLVLAHSPSRIIPVNNSAGAGGSPFGCAAGAGGGNLLAPCSGPCCNPVALLPQGSSSLLPDFSGLAPHQQHYQQQLPYSGACYSGLAAAAGGMVPHAAFGNSSLTSRHYSAPVPGPVAAPAAAAAAGSRQQRPLSTHPPVQGGVQKKPGGSSSGAAGAGRAGKAATEARSQRRSADGSRSSQGGTPVPPAKARKGAAKAAATASGGRSRASATASTAAVAANTSTASLIRELQQEIEALQASKTQLKTQVRTLLTSQTDLLGRVSTLTSKYQAAVAENAALHKQNLRLAASQGP